MIETQPVDKPKHQLWTIGWTGVQSAYMDIPRDEAQRRYRLAEGLPPDEDLEAITDGFEFTDEFGAYAVWEH